MNNWGFISSVKCDEFSKPGMPKIQNQEAIAASSLYFRRKYDVWYIFSESEGSKVHIWEYFCGTLST